MEQVKNKYRFWDTVQQAPWQSVKTGDMLLVRNVKKTGLTQVEKDKIRVDAWEVLKKR